MRREEFGTHSVNVKVGEEEGLVCLYTLVSNDDDWDHYETFQWWAVDDYVRTHPDDPDNPELLEKTRAGKESYLRWARDTVSWAIYVFRKPKLTYNIAMALIHELSPLLEKKWVWVLGARASVPGMLGA